MKKIVFTGGGTAGHVTPNLAIIPHFLKSGWDVHYIGTAQGIERELIEPVKGVTYHAIHSGKLRRYMDIKNLTDPFRVVRGAFEAAGLMRRLKPNVLFSKGGFVSVPVVYGAWLHRVPAVLHESDMTPGLANRITAPLARAICTTFPEAADAMGPKAVYTGTPLRPELFAGDRARGLTFLRFDGRKPVLTMMGGSSGAASVNAALRGALTRLLPHFDIAHICGKGNVDSSLSEMAGYRQLEYVSEALPDLFAATELMLSRAGANALSEILALRKPALLVPYPLDASRGDQILNAASFEKRGFSRVLPQEEMTAESLAVKLLALWEHRAECRKAMEREPLHDGTAKVIEVIETAAKTSA
ncbi:MAG: undecaprenyldiphospho-muramoylpentapeptide beta-N-acetylglucosaminyltransferase [Firmicutes bacterium]|nr:undecaprenyldiphospho-muramoylpentapeptide beta-N-acetylglucosaminyltransferase [Bacillota bacterium]